jgi:hypothetical protein
MTTPFVDEMYDLLKNTLTEYEVIICRWPEYIFVLENVCFKPLKVFFCHSCFRNVSDLSCCFCSLK